MRQGRAKVGLAGVPRHCYTSGLKQKANKKTGGLVLFLALFIIPLV